MVDSAALERLTAVLNRSEEGCTVDQGLDPKHEELIGLIESRKQKVETYGTKTLQMMGAMSWKEGEGLGKSADGTAELIEAKGKTIRGDKRGIGSSGFSESSHNGKRGRYGEVSFIRAEVLAPELSSKPVAEVVNAEEGLRLAREEDELRSLRLAALASLRKP